MKIVVNWFIINKNEFIFVLILVKHKLKLPSNFLFHTDVSTCLYTIFFPAKNNSTIM
jgi:hypothetical protein